MVFCSINFCFINLYVPVTLSVDWTMSAMAAPNRITARTNTFPLRVELGAGMDVLFTVASLENAVMLLVLRPQG